MNRVLIVAGERQAGERFQQALGQAGFQTALVSNPMQMVEFCRQHKPDSLITDLDLAEYGLWTAVQAVRGIGTLANVPFYGLASTENPQLIEQAKVAGYSQVFPTHEGFKPVIDVLEGRAKKQEIEEGAEIEDNVSRDPSLNRLREVTRDIVNTAVRLKPRVGEYGDDGPELFGYIETSSIAIRKKLNAVQDFSLHDKELRHDFRNMIGSVTGFAELIMMEPDISTESTHGLSRLRERSREFVDLLDAQKAEATP